MGNQLAGKRFLFVDDDLEVARLLARVTRLEGAEAEVCSDGDAACELADQEPGFDLILLDLRLGNASSLDVLRELRARGVSCPIIILSAMADRAEVDRCLQAGADGYITKPIGASDLVRRLREHLEPSPHQAT